MYSLINMFTQRLGDCHSQNWHEHINKRARFNVYRTFKTSMYLEPYFITVTNKHIVCGLYVCRCTCAQVRTRVCVFCFVCVSACVCVCVYVCVCVRERYMFTMCVLTERRLVGICACVCVCIYPGTCARECVCGIVTGQLAFDTIQF